MTPNTTYQFRAVAKTTPLEGESKTTIGLPFLSFTTSASKVSSGGSRKTDTGGNGNCYDDIKNGNETDIDTGGRCGSGRISLFPTVNVTASPSSIKSGETSTIRWTSTNADSCNPGIEQEARIIGPTTSGSFNTGALTNSKSYSVTCTGVGGTGSDYVYVYVNGGDGSGNNLFPTVNVTASPSSIKSGETSTIRWTSTNATGCNANVNGSATKTEGSFSTSPLTNSKSYTVTCVGAQGRISGNAYVYVDTGSGSGDGGGSGTWDTGTVSGNTIPLVLGQTATPPNDAIVRYHEGIETVFVRQIIANQIFTKTYGYQEGTNLQTFAWNLADQFARAFGYVSASGREIRVSQPDVAAYQLQLIGNKLTVYEYYDRKIIDIRNMTTVFKNASGYEYYFKKP